jgi:WD40 repeat protein
LQTEDEPVALRTTFLFALLLAAQPCLCDGVAERWRIGGERFRFTGVPVALAISEKSDAVSVLLQSGKLLRFAIPSGKRILDRQISTKPILSGAFSSDAAIVATHEDNGVFRWQSLDGAGGASFQIDPRVRRSTMAVARSAGKLTIVIGYEPDVAAGFDSIARLYVWDGISKRPAIEIMDGPTSGLQGVGVSDDGKYVFDAASGEVRVWGLPDRNRYRCFINDSTLKARVSAAFVAGPALGFTADSNWCGVWNFLTKHDADRVIAREPCGRVVGTSRSNRAVTFSRVDPVGVWYPRELLPRDAKGQCIDATKLTNGVSLVDVGGASTSQAISCDGRLCSAVGRDPIVRVWDLSTGARVGKDEDAEGEVLSIACSKDGGKAAFGCSRGETRFIPNDSVASARRLAENGATSSVESICLSNDGRSAAVMNARSDMTALLWDDKDVGWTKLSRPSWRIAALGFDNDGTHVICSQRNYGFFFNRKGPSPTEKEPHDGRKWQ